jgi:type II secretory pathway component PulM
MKDWFDSLETREQVFVAAGAVIVVVALIYALFWLPLDKSYRQAQQSVADWERSLAELGPGLEQYRRRSQPTSSNGIRVELESVPCDELVLWLGDLSDQYSLHVQAGSLTAIAQAGPGRVNASLTMERAL